MTTTEYPPTSHAPIRELIREKQNGGGGADCLDIAASVIDELFSMSPTDVRAAIFPLIYDEVWQVHRDYTRSHEPGRRSGGKVADPTKARADLLNDTYYFGADFGQLALGDASKEAHMAREAYQTMKASGHMKSARWHGDIARALRKQGCEDLRELKNSHLSVYVKLMEGES